MKKVITRECFFSYNLQRRCAHTHSYTRTPSTHLWVRLLIHIQEMETSNKFLASLIIESFHVYTWYSWCFFNFISYRSARYNSYFIKFSGRICVNGLFGFFKNGWFFLRNWFFRVDIFRGKRFLSEVETRLFSFK